MAKKRWGPISKKGKYSIGMSTARINIWHGSVRSSKSFSSLLRWGSYVSSAPAGPLAVVGKTAGTVKKNIVEPLKEIFGKSKIHYSAHASEMTMLGRDIWCFGADDKQAIDKIQGTTLAGLYGDEVTLWTPGFWDMANTRLSIEDSKAFLTCNPESPFHPIKENWIDKEGELDLRSFHFTLDDNLNLPPAYVEELKKSYSGVFYQRYIEGLWVQAEGAIYDMFNEDYHVIEEMDCNNWRFESYQIGVDYGTSNPTSFVLVGVAVHRISGQKGVFVLDEYYYDSKKKGKQKSSSEYAQELLDFISRNKKEAVANGQIWKFDGVYIDPSASGFKVDCRKLQITMREADNTVETGLNAVGNFFSDGTLRIRRRCIMLRKEIISYVWDPKAQKKGEDKPLKENDHAVDALRYVILAIRKRLFSGSAVQTGIL